MEDIISTASRSELTDWAREVARIIADSDDADTLQSFTNLPIRSALFLYLNYDTARDSARRLLDNNYIEIDDRINDIVAVYSNSMENYYELLLNLHTVAFSTHPEEYLDRVLQNDNIREIYMNSEDALYRYNGTTFLRDLPLIEDFDPDTGYPLDDTISYWILR